MNDLLRKHGKWILAVMGVVLMFIWMRPNSNANSEGQNEKMVRGTLNGKKVTNADLASARNDLIVLQKLDAFLLPHFIAHPNLPKEQIMPYARLHSFVAGIKEEDQAEVHFYLLQKEAGKFGLAATPDDVRGLLGALQLDEATIQDFISMTKDEIQKPSIDRALGSFALVSKLENLAMGALQPSLPEIEYLADQSLAQLKIRYLVFSAQEPLPNLPAPTDEAVKAQVAAYKSILPPIITHQDPPVINGHDYPFGYKYSDRVKVEYLTFNRDEIIKLIHPGSKDWEAALAYFKANQGEFTEKPAADVTGPPPLARVKTFEEVKDQLIKRQIEQNADKLLEKMVKAAQAMTTAPWKEVDESGYHKLIERSRWVSYSAVAADLKERFGYEPKVIAPDEWLNAANLHVLPGIGEAVLINDNRVQSDFPTAALHVKEIDPNPAQAWMRVLQVGVDGPVLYDIHEDAAAHQRHKNSAYLYRVLDASKTHEAAGELEMADVSAHAKADLLRVATFQEYQKRGRDIAQEAAKTNLETVAKQNQLTPADTSFRRLSMYLEPVNIPGLGILPKFADACFDLAAHSSLAPSAHPTTGPATTATTTAATAATAPATAPKAGPPTGAVPIDAQLKVVVVEITDYQPLPTSMLESLPIRQSLVEMARTPKEQAFRARWIDPNSVAERLNFVPHTPFKSGKSAEE